MIAANIAKLAELFGAKTNVGTTREMIALAKRS